MYNPRRQEVAKSLPPAPQTMLQYVWQKSMEAGIAIDTEDFTLLIRSVVDYLDTTAEGKRVMLKLLKASTKDGSYQKQYYKAGHLGDEEKQFEYKHLTEYRGWIYKEYSAPFDAVEVWDKPDLEACEMCCGLFPKGHCLITVRTHSNGKENLENMCNRCRMLYDDPKIKESASSKTCESCEMRSCQFNPKRQEAFRKDLSIGQSTQESKALVAAGPVGVPVKPVIKSTVPTDVNRYSAF